MSSEEKKHAVSHNCTVKFNVSVISPHKVGFEIQAMKIQNLPQTFHCINLIIPSTVTMVITAALLKNHKLKAQGSHFGKFSAH